MPYSVKDGQSNPGLEKYDRNPLTANYKAVNTLSVAYFYSKKAGMPETITFSIGNILQKGSFTIQKSDDMDWLTVALQSGRINFHSKLNISLTATTTDTKFNPIGMIIIRLQGGLSIPITIFAE